MDLIAGLHWLRENLPAFGGDPESITVMGHGTGAALANFIAVSPVAKGGWIIRYILHIESAYNGSRSVDSILCCNICIRLKKYLGWFSGF